MPVVCPSCGQENPDVARFCLAYGARLDVPTPAAEERNARLRPCGEGESSWSLVRGRWSQADRYLEARAAG